MGCNGGDHSSYRSTLQHVTCGYSQCNFGHNFGLGSVVVPRPSFHPLLKPNTSPGTNRKPAAIGNPEAAIVPDNLNLDEYKNLLLKKLTGSLEITGFNIKTYILKG